MKSFMRPALGLFVFVLLWHPAQAGAQSSKIHCMGTLSPISSAYTKAITVLRSKTRVPLRLPNCVWGVEKPYTVVKSAGRDGYVLVLGATPDCEGQHVCSYGTVIGTSLPLDQIAEYDITRRPRTQVRLRKGLTGYFYASVCGAYCSDSFITWTEGRYHYIIGLKDEEKSNLLASVNSAIEASVAQTPE